MVRQNVITTDQVQVAVVLLTVAGDFFITGISETDGVFHFTQKYPTPPAHRGNGFGKKGYNFRLIYYP